MSAELRDWNHIISTQVMPMLSEPGITRGQIAERLGIPYSNINTALHKFGVQVQAAPKKGRQPKGPRTFTKSVPMEAALTSEQCYYMRRFLGRLAEFADDNKGRRVDVGRFMSEYREGV